MPVNFKVAPRWSELLKPETEKDYFSRLMEFLQEEYLKNHVVPAKNLIFKSLELTDFDGVKVVIIGQDPYPTEGMANGIAFGVPDAVYPKPKTFINILKELSTELWQDGKYSNALDAAVDLEGSSFEGWARQGVLMLNSCLTSEKDKPKSHRNKGWEQFVARILKYVCESDSKVVFMIWGDEAKTLATAAGVFKQVHHLILECAHPSPQAMRSKKPFAGCGHFIRANKFLELNGMQPVDWTRIS